MSDCEPLMGKERNWYEYGEHTDHENIETKCFDKKDVVSACRFYKKYRNHPRDCPKEIWGLFEKWRDETMSDEIDRYNHWFFDYCFGDILNG